MQSQVIAVTSLLPLEMGTCHDPFSDSWKRNQNSINICKQRYSVHGRIYATWMTIEKGGGIRSTGLPFVNVYRTCKSTQVWKAIRGASTLVSGKGSWMIKIKFVSLKSRTCTFWHIHFNKYCDRAPLISVELCIRKIIVTDTKAKLTNSTRKKKD